MLVVAVFGHEFLVGAALYDAAFVEHADKVGVFNGGEAVGYYLGGTAVHQSVEGLLHEFLALGIEGGGGLVEN